MKIVILEGLPMVGKTTIINYIKSLSLKNVQVVNELIINTEDVNMLKNIVVQVVILESIKIILN